MDRSNRAESETVKTIAEALMRGQIDSKNIGIIAPYTAQITCIRELLHGNEDLEVKTVDSFQGREKDVIVFSATSTGDLSFVQNENRLNVALTRAKKKLIVVGNAKSIVSQPGLLSDFVSYVKEKGGYYGP